MLFRSPRRVANSKGLLFIDMAEDPQIAVKKDLRVELARALNLPTDTSTRTSAKVDVPNELGEAIMITWGLCAAATALAQGPISYAVIRLLAGIAEAGFFPGVIFFLSLWFPAHYRTRMMAWFLFAIPMSSVLGGPLSVAMLAMDGGLVGPYGVGWLKDVTH